jgi:hypothetical protein
MYIYIGYDERVIAKGGGLQIFINSGRTILIFSEKIRDFFSERPVEHIRTCTYVVACCICTYIVAGTTHVHILWHIAYVHILWPVRHTCTPMFSTGRSLKKI